jgi:CBS domain-containing protein
MLSQLLEVNFKKMKASEIMTLGVYTVRPEASIKEAASLMRERGISGLPVVDKTGRLVGIVTEGDLLRRAEIGTERRRPRWLVFVLGPGRLANEYVRSHARKVQDIMTPEVVSVSKDMPLQEVVNILEKRRIKRVPVTRDDKLVGIISRANLVHALARLVEEAPPTRPDDEAAREKIMVELNKQPWTPRTDLNVIVRGGVAELWGAISDEREREAIRVVAENVPGVSQVIDHLVCFHPMRGGMGLPPLISSGD